MVDVEVLVVGAGSAGAAVAGQLARAGRQVVLVDRRPVGATGARWVNGVPAWCFDAADVVRPSGDELWKHGGTFRMVAPGGGTAVAHDGVDEVFHVDMPQFVGRLIRDAVARGVRFEQGRVHDVTFGADERVSSVTFRRPDGRLERLSSRLVVDASGLGAAVRRRVPELARACERVDALDICVAAQHSFRVRDAEGLRSLLARHGAEPGDDVAFPGTCGGYSTLTLFTQRDLHEVGVLAGSIPATGANTGAHMIDQFRESAPWLGEHVSGGRGPIPVRRPYDRLAAHGVALVGDSACQVYASHGSGVGMGLLAGRVLVDEVGRAQDPGDHAALAAYERSYKRQYGGLLAASDAFRRFTQGIGAEMTGRLMRAGLVDTGTFSQVLAQRPTRLSPTALARLARNAARSPLMAARFGSIAVRSQALERLAGRGTGEAWRSMMSRLTNGLVGASPNPRARTSFVHPESVAPSASGASREGSR